jgi:hypothetical protein
VECVPDSSELIEAIRQCRAGSGYAHQGSCDLCDGECVERQKLGTDHLRSSFSTDCLILVVTGEPGGMSFH